MEIHELDHLVLNVSDVERSLAWYTGLLGLDGVRVDEWRRGEAPFPSVRVSPGCIIDLFAADEVAPAGSLNHFCLVARRTDVDAIADDDRFTVVDGPDRRYGARGDGWSIYVTDPDGNTVEIRSYD
ncbi:MAG: VOC family protein [Ilumatobacteraceae bacterium]|nr:VOC family protein [Ilumatobacteraceae bacterium]